MDRIRFSHIAHREMEFCSPVGAGRVARAIELMGLLPGAEVLDIGAGKCGWLARILGVVPESKAIGIEPAKLFADEAEARHAGMVADGRLRVVRSDAAEYLKSVAGRRFDAVLCIGSTHALGGHEGTLDTIKACLRPGGAAVVAEGYWKKPPSPEYLAALGGDESEFTTHAGNIQRAIDRGLTPRWCCAATDDEWDEYEWGYSRGIETWVGSHPADPDAAAMLSRSRSWREAYMRWGRETLGFGVYVLGV